MREDTAIQRDVEAELNTRPCPEPMRVTAAVHDGVVQLSGFVCSYCEKYHIEDAVRRISGVAAVVNGIEVRIPAAAALTDDEIRCIALRALETELPAVADRLEVSVRNGEVTLAGCLGWHFLRERAESAVRRTGSIAVVHNAITLEPEALSREVQRVIEEALRCGAWAEAGDLSVRTQGSEVTLLGHVRSDAERQLAEQAAWSVPGVTRVKNEIARPS